MTPETIDKLPDICGNTARCTGLIIAILWIISSWPRIDSWGEALFMFVALLFLSWLGWCALISAKLVGQLFGFLWRDYLLWKANRAEKSR